MRLIDAELTAKNIARHRIYTLEVGNDEMNKMMEGYNPSAFSAGFDYGMELAQKLVSNQSTAYDIDKVVEQLEKEKNKEANDSLELSLLGKRERAKEHSYGALCLEDAIKIVKKGGVV